MALNYLGIAVAAIAAWIAGAIWYGVFSKPWMKALGCSEEEMSGRPKMPVGPMIISFIAELIMAALLAGLIGHFGTVSIQIGVICGGLSWLAFVATTITVNNAFQKRKPALTIIDGGHWLVVLLIEGAVIGAFG